MFYIQIAAAVVSVLLGISQIVKERPLMNIIQPAMSQTMLKADEISRMEIQWQYRGNDQHWVYYSDQIGRYWCRVNQQGIREYSENPQYQN